MEEQAAEMNGEWDVQNQDNFDPAAGEGEAGGATEDAVAPAGTVQDAAPTTSAVVEAAVDAAEATMGAAPAASAAGAEAAATKPEDLGTVLLGKTSLHANHEFRARGVCEQAPMWRDNA